MPSDDDHPISKFPFLVEWGEGVRVSFTEVSGLVLETEVMEYREGREKDPKSKLSGLNKSGDVILKRGIVEGGGAFARWIQSVVSGEDRTAGTRVRQCITIK